MLHWKAQYYLQGILYCIECSNVEIPNYIYHNNYNTGLLDK